MAHWAKLPEPTIGPAMTYVASVGINAYDVATNEGLATQVTDGPLSTVADGQNGVFATTPGHVPRAVVPEHQLLRGRDLHGGSVGGRMS